MSRDDDMSAADRARWASARTLADLGELTAQWLEGGIASQPGYCGPSDIEAPAMVPVLAGLNRAGFVTTASQAGSAGTRWQQRAAVEGFASARLASRIIAAFDGRTGLVVIAYAPWELPRWRYGYDGAAVVTTRDGQPYTRFGVQLPRRHIRSRITGYGICRRDAVNALCSACQVTVIDPGWGRDDLLWPLLAEVAGGAA